MAIYVYRYSGFPDRKSDKYYVGNYRKGKAHTYQVVPQLQLQFDREGRGERSELEWERFKRLRSRGSLYTANRSGERAPWHPELEPGDYGRAWRPLVEWLAGEVAPAEVDWAEVGARLRAQLAVGAPLPESLRTSAGAVGVGEGETLDRVWERLRGVHLEACWFHLTGVRTADELAVVEGREWSDLSEEVEEGRPVGTARRLRESIRETRPEGRAPDEEAFLEQLGDAWGEEVESWEQADRQLEDLGSRYEDLEVGEPHRVPDERLYDAHWSIARMLDRCRLHHPAATARFPGHGGALHARFHAGAVRAVQMRLESYPAALEVDRVEAELEREARGGAFAGWSEEGLETVARWLRDPVSGRLAAGSPVVAIANEICLWDFDERVAREVDAVSDDGQGGRWRYSRHGAEILLSSPGEEEREEMKRVRRAVEETAGVGEVEVAGERVRFWREGRSRLETDGGLIVPARAGDRIELPLERRRRVRSALSAAASGEANPEDARESKAVHPVVGDPRCGTCGGPAMAAAGADLMRALVVSEFYEAFRRGWYRPATSRRGAATDSAGSRIEGEERVR